MLLIAILAALGRTCPGDKNCAALATVQLNGATAGVYVCPIAWYKQLDPRGGCSDQQSEMVSSSAQAAMSSITTILCACVGARAQRGVLGTAHRGSTHVAAALDEVQRSSQMMVSVDCHPPHSGKLGNRDVHLEAINISNGGQELVSDSGLTLANGHRYGLVGRNGTGKTTMLRALATHQVKGIPDNC